jgi:hypothetical protein
MTEVLINEDATITIFLLDDSGDFVTGLGAADTIMYIRKEGGSSASKTMSGANFDEIDATNMPGLYEITFSAADLDTAGEFVAVLRPDTPGTFEQQNIRLDVVLTKNVQILSAISSVHAAVDDVATDLGGVTTSLGNVASDITDIQGAGFDTNTDSLTEIRSNMGDTSALEAKVDDILEIVERVLGLSQENIRITDQTYDSNNNLTGSVLRIFENAGDVATLDSPIAAYEMTASYDPSNRLTDYRIVRTS